MKIVIDISERAFEFVKENGLKDIFAIDSAIRNGVILPEGHGRLIDADEFFSEFPELAVAPYVNSKTIVPADKEG